MCLVNPNHANTQKTITHVFIKRFYSCFLVHVGGVALQRALARLLGDYFNDGPSAQVGVPAVRGGDVFVYFGFYSIVTPHTVPVVLRPGLTSASTSSSSLFETSLHMLHRFGPRGLASLFVYVVQGAIVVWGRAFVPHRTDLPN